MGRILSRAMCFVWWPMAFTSAFRWLHSQAPCISVWTTFTSVCTQLHTHAISVCSGIHSPVFVSNYTHQCLYLTTFTSVCTCCTWLYSPVFVRDHVHQCVVPDYTHKSEVFFHVFPDYIHHSCVSTWLHKLVFLPPQQDRYTVDTEWKPPMHGRGVTIHMKHETRHLAVHGLQDKIHITRLSMKYQI